MQPKAWNRIFTVLFLMAFVAGVIQPAALAAPIERETAASATQEDALAKIEPLVLEEIAENGETEFFVWLTAKADLSPAKNLKTKLEKGQFVYDTLRATADSSQAALRAELDAQRVEYRPFYIANKIFIYSGNESLVMSLAARSDVAKITPNRQFQLDEPMINPRAPEHITAIEPNISFIRAPEVWDLGFRGEGLVMAGNDTGLDWDHPALINQYRGWDGSSVDHNYNWWDATGTYPNVPDDGHGHGTHTTGTMVGDDGGANQIGVAPGAQTIHCKNMTDGGSGNDFTFTTCFEWDLAPWDLTGSNPMPSLAPHAINNSWGYFGGGAPQFEDEIDALQAAGIVVEVSAGNEGPSCGTLRSPSDYLQVMTTGSVNHAGGVLPGTLTGFSSRGPSSLYPGEFFPDIMAPGQNIRSSVPGGGYQGGWSGTSMSGPHATALIALMWQAAPGFLGMVEETYDIIYSTAVPLTGQGGSNCGGDYDTGPNNDWGFGTIDALAAVEEAMRLDNPFRLVVTPATQEVCTPDGFSYNVDVLQNEPDFEEPVTLSAFGAPPDYTHSFDVNPVIPPGSSTLSFSNSGPSAHGSYSIDVLGMALTYTVTSTVSVDLFTETPGTISLTAPADGATNVDLRPTFEWTAAVQGSTYYLEVAGDPGFGTVVYEAIVSGTSHQAETLLDPVTEYWWRVTPLNACGEGLTSEVFSFTTRAIPPILVVDDDNNSPDVRSYYTNALDGLGLFYDVWDTNGSDNEPSAAELAPYEFVVWFTGVAFGGSAGPGAAGEAALGEWLDSGGCFFISSQDYLFDRGSTPFMQNYLGLSTFTHDVAQTSVTGAGSVFGGLGPYTLSYPFSNWSDRISPDASAEVAFIGNQGDAAINKDGGAYQTTFWGFPFEALPNNTAREETLQTIVDWCGVGGETGFIAGTVTDAVYGTPIAGASVEAGGRAVLTDASGEYSMRLPVGVYDVTASAENYVSVTVFDVEVLLDQTTTVDFELEGSSLFYEPEFIEEFMQIGDVVANTVTVYNTGPLPIDFSVRIKDFTSPAAASQPQAFSLPASDGSFQRGEAAPSAFAPPADGGPAPGAVLESVEATILNGTTAYSWNSANGPYYTVFDTDVPQVLPIVTIFNTGAFIGAGEFVDDSVYMIDTNHMMYEVDPESGALIDTIPVTAPPAGHSYTGMAIDPTSGDVYLTSCDIATTRLYGLDVASGTADFIGTVTNSPCTIAIAIDGTGQMYGHDIVNDSLIRIDKTSGAGEIVGSLGFDANFGQGMGWDPATDTLYLAAFNNTAFQAELRIADRSTGNTTLVGVLGETFPGGLNQLGYLAFEQSTTPPWAFAVPDSGTVDPGEEFTFEVIFDASSLFVTGDYTANLEFSGTFVNDPPIMPLTMHLACDTCGFLEGQIFDEWTGDPLSASIHITGPGGFDVTLTGESYSLAVQPGTYDFVVSTDGYFDATASVEVVQGETTVTDFHLIPMAALLEYSPAFIEEEMEVGDVVANTVTVFNPGTIPLEFSVSIGGYSGPSGAPSAVPHLVSPDEAVGFTTPAPVGPASVRSPEGRAALDELNSPLAWANGAPMPTGLVRYAHVQCDDQPDSFYVISGVDPNFSVTNGAWRYDASSDSWTTLASIPVGQEGPAGTCYQGNIYVAGGGGTNQFYIYNIASNSWSAGPALPRNVWGAAMGAWEGKVYVIGGDSDFFFGGTSDQVNIYDIASGTWSLGTPMPTAAVTAGSQQAGSHVYVVGGWGDLSPGVNVDATQRYDMATDTWETGPTFTSARGDFALAITADYLYAIGGDANGGGAFDPVALVESLDHAAWPGGSWTNINDPLPQAVTAINGGFCTTPVTGGEIWAPGGFTGSVVLNTNRYRASEACFTGATPWASAVPNSGTVNPGEEFTFEVIFDATSLFQIGTYTANLNFSGNFVNDPPTMPLTMHLSCPTCGFLEGSIFDAWTGDPLVANITIEGMGGFNVTLTGDSYFLSVPADTYTISVEANDYFPDSATVMVETGQTVTTDFHLTPMVALLEYSPASIEETVLLGEVISNIVTVSNPGTIPLEFSVRIRDFAGPLGGEPVQIDVPAGGANAPEGTAAGVSQPSSDARPAGSYSDLASFGPTQTSILIVHADDGDGEPLRSILLGYPDIETVDVWDARAGFQGVPPLEVLEAYPIVITWSNFPYEDRIAMGNVLADYVDNGGLVIQGVFNWIDNSNWGLGGRFVTDGYSPFVNINGGNHFNFSVLGDYDASHPIMEGVTAASDFYRDIVNLDPDATLVASWADGEEFVATKESVVAINSYPGFYYQWTGDIGMIFHNAVNYLLEGTAEPWAFAVPDSGTVPPGEEFTFEVIFDASIVEELGTYTANLTFTGNFGNDPAPMPLTMHVVPVPLYQTLVNAGGEEYTDGSGDTWVPDKVYTPGDWGYTRAQAPSHSTNRNIEGTDDQPLYRTLRQDPMEYRFDGLPDGTYEIKLRFAEIQNTRPGQRVFDVIIQDTVVLPSYDIAARVGTFQADEHIFTFEITGGQLSIRLVSGPGRPPIINAIGVSQITHAP